MPSFYEGQKVSAYFESRHDSSLNGFYTGIVKRVLQKPGMAPSYDILFDDGDKSTVGSQSLNSMEAQYLEEVSEDELTAIPEPTKPAAEV